MKPFLEKEGSILSSIYFADHTFDPRLGQYGCLKYGIGPAGDQRAAAVAEKLRGWLRAGVLWPSLVAYDVTPRGFTGKQAEWGGVELNQGSITAAGAPHSWSPPVAVCSCGGRSWAADHRKVKVDGKERLQFKVPWYIAVSTAGNVVAEFGLGRTPNRRSGVAEALRDRFGVNPHDLLFSVEERAIIARLVTNKRDFEAIRWAIREIGPYLPKHPVRFLAFEGGLATVCPYHAKGATSSSAARVLYPDGRGVTLSADSLMRGSASAYNREQFAEVDLDQRVIRAWCPADDNQPATAAQIDLPPGEIIYHLEVSFDGGWVDHSPSPVLAKPTPTPEPVPGPTPGPRPKPSKRKNLNWAVILGALVIFGLILTRGC